MDFLVIYAEISMAFVAFATIVATLRQALGKPLTPLQNQLLRFFVEIGFLLLFQAMIPIALLSIWADEADVWLLSTYTILATAALYLPFYIHRRRKIGTNIPLVSRLVMYGYGIVIVATVLTATGRFWEPSLATTTYFLLWGLFSNIVIFVYFLGTFVEIDREDAD